MRRNRLIGAVAAIAACPPSAVISIALALIALVGLVDYVTGPQVSVSFFFLAPVALAAWSVSRGAGVALALLSAAVWLVADLASGEVYAHAALAYWNAGIRLAFFLTFALVLHALRQALGRERVLARTDPLTGLCNSRWFDEVNRAEHQRALRYRHPYALLFIDVDGFKTINDTRGHAAGDELLIEIARVLGERTRETDTVARVGGDEFAVLLPETEAPGAERLAAELEAALREHATDRWPVAFSIGVAVDCQRAASSRAALHTADGLMYTVKRARQGGRRVGPATSGDDVAPDSPDEPGTSRRHTGDGAA